MHSWQKKLDALRASGITLDLPTLIPPSQSHELSPSEMASIRKAWVVKELQFQQPQLKRLRAEALYEEARKKLLNTSHQEIQTEGGSDVLKS